MLRLIQCSTIMPANLSMAAARAVFIIMAAIIIGVSSSAVSYDVQLPPESEPYTPTGKFNIDPSVFDASSTTAYEQPPYWGTTWVEPNIITPTDPTSYKDYTYRGMGMRNMYDRRQGWVYVSVHLYKAHYSISRGRKKTIEFFVHNEFTRRDAAKEMKKYAPAVGQMPWTFIAGLGQVWIMKGDESWGGGTAYSPHIHIHTGATDIIQGGIIEETLLHEAVHAVLDDRIYSNPAWFDAAHRDGRFISTYAQDFPQREDAAETILLCLAGIYRPGRLTRADRGIISRTIPNRCQYVFNQGYTLSPFDFSELFDESVIGASLIDSTTTSGMFSMNSGGGGLFVGLVAIVAVVVGAVGLLLARKKEEHDGYEEILPKNKQTTV